MPTLAGFDAGDWVAHAGRLLLHSWRFRVWAIGCAVLAAILCFVPLFRVLGFEFAFALGIVASLASLDLGAALARHLRASRVTPAARAVMPLALVVSAWARAALAALALLAAPLFIICINALRVRNCDFLFGFEVFLLLPMVSVVIASGVGLAAGLAIGQRRKLGLAAPYLIFVLSALHSVWRFYAAPPVFSYNVFAGYFPGNLYDEAISLGAPLLWSRLYQLAIVSVLLAAAATLLDVPRAAINWRAPRRPEGLRIAPLLALVFTSSLAVTLKIEAGELGFDIDADDIGRELDSHHETEHFIIRYRGGGEIGDAIELIGEDHEFRLAQLVRTLGVAPRGKITSFYFSSAAEKAALMGAKNVYMAKPWRREIYLNHLDFPHHVLRHEIAHVVAGEFGDPIFGVSARGFLGLPLRFNVGLIEGLAVAADWPDHFNKPLTPHQSVKALTELEMAPPLSGLLSTGFLTVSSARSYTTSGSFVRFLLETRGAEKVRALYRSGGDFGGVYGESLSSLAEEWRKMVDETPLPPGAAEIIRERFRRRSIFQRKCPHAIARAIDRAAELAGRGRLDEAIETMRGVCDDAPGEPRYLMQLANLLVRADKGNEADAIYASLAADVENISSDLRARSDLARAELAAAAGEWESAIDLVRLSGELPVEDDVKRLAVVQAIIGADPSPTGLALRGYFWGTRPGRRVDAVASVARVARALSHDPSSALAHYLVGFNLRHRDAPADATASLSRALDLGLPHPLIRREAARLLAEVAYIARDEKEVMRAAAILAEPDQPLVMRLYAADWVERLHWRRTGSLPDQPVGPDDVPRQEAPAPDRDAGAKD